MLGSDSTCMYGTVGTPSFSSTRGKPEKFILLTPSVPRIADPDMGPNQSPRKAGSGPATKAKIQEQRLKMEGLGRSQWTRGGSADQWSQICVISVRSRIRIRTASK